MFASESSVSIRWVSYAELKSSSFDEFNQTIRHIWRFQKCIHYENAVCFDYVLVNYITQISWTTSLASVKKPAPAAVTADVHSPESERHHVNRTNILSAPGKSYLMLQDRQIWPFERQDAAMQHGQACGIIVNKNTHMLRWRLIHMVVFKQLPDAGLKFRS